MALFFILLLWVSKIRQEREILAVSPLRVGWHDITTKPRSSQAILLLNPQILPFLLVPLLHVKDFDQKREG